MYRRAKRFRVASVQRGGGSVGGDEESAADWVNLSGGMREGYDPYPGRGTVERAVVGLDLEGPVNKLKGRCTIRVLFGVLFFARNVSAVLKDLVELL